LFSVALGHILLFAEAPGPLLTQSNAGCVFTSSAKPLILMDTSLDTELSTVKDLQIKFAGDGMADEHIAAAAPLEPGHAAGARYHVFGTLTAEFTFCTNPC